MVPKVLLEEHHSDDWSETNYVCRSARQHEKNVKLKHLTRGEGEEEEATLFWNNYYMYVLYLFVTYYNLL